MAKKVILKNNENVEILPITRGELVLDSSGNEAFHSNAFLATTSLPGLMSKDDKKKLDGLFNVEVDDVLDFSSENPVQNKVVSTAIKNITDSYLKSADVNGNTLTITDQDDDTIDFFNTTYSFADGTDGSFTVTPSGGNAQTVKVGGILTDDKVKLTPSSDNKDYRVLFSYTDDDNTKTEGSRKSSKLKFNPSSGALTATTLIGQLDGTYVNKLTNYKKASEASDLTVADSLNTALGKLEYKADTAFTFYSNIMGPDTDDIINKYDEIVNFIDSVKETETDILDTFVTRKTTLTITGAKTFSKIITSTVTDSAPFSVASKTVVTNLNSDLLDGFEATTLFQSLSNVNTETNPNSISIKIGNTTKYLKVGYADKVGSNFTLKVNSGTTEGTDKYTYNGSTAKTLNIKPGSNVSFSTNSGELTINSSYVNTTYSLSGALSSTNNSYTVTLTPSKGSATTATISKMVGATSSAAGKAGLVPKPNAGSQNMFLKGDGSWSSPINTWRNIKVNGTQIAGTSADTYSVDYISGDGINVTGVSGTSTTKNNTITITNAGVRSVTIGTGDNSNKLAVNTNGNTTYLTIPYATLASKITCTASTDNIDRPIVLTNTSDKLYYSTKATINYSTGNLITSGNISAYNFTLTGTGTSDFSKGIIKFDTINIPTSSGGSTYGIGTSGLVLKSNGSTVYWDNSIGQVSIFKSNANNIYPVVWTNKNACTNTSGTANTLYVDTESSAGYNPSTNSFVASNFIASTQVTTPKVHSDGRLTLNTTKEGLDLKWLNDNTKSVILNGTAFKPFDAANDKLTLGSVDAKWSHIYAALTVNTPTLTSPAVLNINAGNTEVQIQVAATSTQSVVLNTTSFGPFKAANGLLSSGRSDARWSNIYSVLGNFTGNVTIKKGNSILDENGWGIVGINPTGWTGLPSDGSAIGFGTGAAPVYIRTNSDNLYHYHKTNNASYKILDSNNSSVTGAGGSTWGSSITVKINGTTKTLTIPANPNTWRPITNSYSGTATDTSLSLKGANDLYNALVNGNASTLDNLDSTDFLRNVSLNGTFSSVDKISTSLIAGIHRLHIAGVEYSSILTGYDWNGSYWLLYFHPSSGYTLDIRYRATNCSTWKTLLDSNNSSVSGEGGSTWGSSITVKINGVKKTLTIPSNPLSNIKTLTFSAGTFSATTYNGSANVTVNVPSNFNHIKDATSVSVTSGTVKRKVIVTNVKSEGYISRASIGLSNPANQFSPVIIGVGTNDGGTTFTDYYFHPGGSITDSKGNTYAKTSQIPTIPNLSLGTTTGSGNAVTSISVDGHKITLNKGTTFLTSHQSLANYVTLNTALTISGVKTFKTQLKFTVAQGTAPFTVTSTTKVTNLNADYLDGLSSGSFGIWRGIIATDPEADDTTYTSTSTFLSQLHSLSKIFNSNFGAFRGSWYYVGNVNYDTGVGTLDMAGTAVLNISGNTSNDVHYKSLFFLDRSGLLYSYVSQESGVAAWSRYAKSSEIPKKTSQLTNNSGFLTSRGYWANVAVSASSSTSTSPTFQECYVNGWFRSTGNNGWYNPTHNSHIHPNATTTYGNLVVRGTKSDYTGINLGNSTNHMTVMSTATHHGLYHEGGGLWEFYYNSSSKGVGIRTSTITKNFNVSGSSYLSSNTWIGTTSGSEMLNVGGWVGTVGSTGWYSVTHKGGWYMTDTTYVRVYNNKSIYTTGNSYVTSYYSKDVAVLGFCTTAGGWTGGTAKSTVVGANYQTHIRSSGDNLYHYHWTNGANYKILDANNWSSVCNIGPSWETASSVYCYGVSAGFYLYCRRYKLGSYYLVNIYGDVGQNVYSDLDGGAAFYTNSSKKTKSQLPSGYRPSYGVSFAPWTGASGDENNRGFSFNIDSSGYLYYQGHADMPSAMGGTTVHINYTFIV